MEQAPVVIIGGGTSGSVAARTLADSTSLPIVVLEPGGVTDDDNPRFLDGLTEAVLWPGEAMPQARAVGGGSAVNGMLLSGEPPGWLEGLVRRATPEEAGELGRALLGAGGRLSWMWWNNGRWNPGRAMKHVEEEGRVRIVRQAAVSLVLSGDRAVAVRTTEGEIACSHVVMCAGAVLTPRILRASGIGGQVGAGLQNHPTVTFTIARQGEDVGFFDACVVQDLLVDGGIGLMIAYERETAAVPRRGAVSVSLMNPVSRGTAGASADFALLSDPLDRARMDSLVATARGIVSGMGSTVIGESGVHPVSHATSSCARATDEVGNLHGFGNITVADASVIPGVPAETPAASVTMWSLRISRALGRRLS